MDGAHRHPSVIDKIAPRTVSARPPGLTQLHNAGHLSAAECEALKPVAEQFGVAISPQMLLQIDTTKRNDPIAAQFVPTSAELKVSAEELADPIGDHQHAPVTGIIHRYPDRVLLTPTHICPVYCRFCFRRESVGQQKSLSEPELEAAFDYIETHKEIWEVILSGGDPLILSPRRLKKLLTRLRKIEHVKIIRIHTRVPVVSPEKITPELIATLRDANPLYVVLHTNHAQEFSDAAKTACAGLADAGIPLLSQTVLLKGINDTAATLGKLMRLLVENRIKPYYLHHGDKARGTSHFRTSIADGQALIRELRGNYSGLCQPEYVLDIPGGAGKAPIGPQYIAAKIPNQSGNNADYDNWEVTDFRNRQHSYTEERTIAKKK
jgi:lysine 2,3-aminomutase